MTKTVTKKMAFSLHETEFWRKMDARTISLFQLNTDRLCMPFQVFHSSVEEAIGRAVYIHELVRDREKLIRELLEKQGS